MAGLLKIGLLVSFWGLLIFLSPPIAFAQEDQTPVDQETEILEGTVVGFGQQRLVPSDGEPIRYRALKIKITRGSLEGQEIETEPISELKTVYKEGDRLVIEKTQTPDGEPVYFVADYQRQRSLLSLFLIFLVLAVVIGNWRGLTSLIGLGVSFGAILGIILPLIDQGNDPVLVAILGAIVIILATFYLSHGVNAKTTVSVIGTFIALIFTGILAKLYVEGAHLTGFASEEAGFVQIAKGGTVNIKGLLLAGIIIGVLGVLDDITVSQAAIVEQLKEANRKLSADELFKRAMEVGRDHIASMVNTLVLVYTGSALPLLILFINSPYSLAQVVNYEIIAEEIIRTLVGSIGLIAAVPITTFLSSLYFSSVSQKRK